jgi:hypothetical protein
MRRLLSILVASAAIAAASPAIAQKLGVGGAGVDELDDASHRRRRDHARDVLTDIAGYRTIRLEAARRQTLASVRETISLGLA